LRSSLGASTSRKKPEARINRGIDTILKNREAEKIKMKFI
jgi:hypothetical protein